MTYTFVYQAYKQQPSATQEHVFQNVLCDVFEYKAFGRINLKLIPVTNELPDTTYSDSIGDSIEIVSDEN